jgi:hypothetical protein
MDSLYARFSFGLILPISTADKGVVESEEDGIFWDGALLRFLNDRRDPLRENPRSWRR